MKEIILIRQIHILFWPGFGRASWVHLLALMMKKLSCKYHNRWITTRDNAIQFDDLKESKLSSNFEKINLNFWKKILRRTIEFYILFSTKKNVLLIFLKNLLRIINSIHTRTYYIYIYIYIYIYTYIYIYIYIYTYIYIYILHINVYIYIYLVIYMIKTTNNKYKYICKKKKIVD